MGEGKGCAELGLPVSWGQSKFPSVLPPAADIDRDEVPHGHVLDAQGHCPLPQISIAGMQDISKKGPGLQLQLPNPCQKV